MGNDWSKVPADVAREVAKPIVTGIEGGINIIRDAQGNVTGIINKAQDNITSIIRDGEVIVKQTERDIATVTNNLQQNITNSFQMVASDIGYSYRDTTTKAVLAIDNALDNSIYTANKLGTEMISTVQFGMFLFFFLPTGIFLVYGDEIMGAVKSIARNGSVKFALV